MMILQLFANANISGSRVSSNKGSPRLMSISDPSSLRFSDVTNSANNSKLSVLRHQSQSFIWGLCLIFRIFSGAFSVWLLRRLAAEKSL